MNARKRNRLIAAGIVTTVVLLVVLVAVMIYQIVEICVLNKRREELKEQIAQYEQKLEETDDLIDYYETQDGLMKLYIEYGILNGR